MSSSSKHWLARTVKQKRIEDSRLEIGDLTRARFQYGDEDADGNYKSQNSNNKQIPMTKIRNSKPQDHFKLKKR